MASFNGVDLGLVFALNVGANPKGRQINTYAGANGLEVIDQGSRGGHSIVAGALIGIGAASLASVEQSLRSLHVDGGAYVLVDTLGTAWAGVILVDFEPEGRVYQVVGPYGLYYLARKYRAEFLHVS